MFRLHQVALCVAIAAMLFFSSCGTVDFAKGVPDESPTSGFSAVRQASEMQPREVNPIPHTRLRRDDPENARDRQVRTDAIPPHRGSKGEVLEVAQRSESDDPRGNRNGQDEVPKNEGGDAGADEFGEFDEFDIDIDQIDVDVDLDRNVQWTRQIPQGVDPQHVYDLDRLVEIALRTSHRIKAAQFHVEAERARVAEADWQWFPRIIVSAYIAPAPKYDEPDTSSLTAFITHEESWVPETVTMQAKLSLQQPLYTSGRIGSARRMARSAEGLTRLKLERTRCDTVHDVRKAYFSLQFINKLIAILAEAISIVEQAHETLERLLQDESDSVTQLDVYKLEVVGAEIRARHREAVKSREVLLAAARLFLSLEKDTPFYLDTEDLEEIAYENREERYYLDYTMANRPEIRMLRFGMDLAEANTEYRWADMFPVFYLGLGARYKFSPDNYEPSSPYLDNPYKGWGVGVALGMRWELDIPQKHARYRQARAKMYAAREMKELALQGIQLEVTNAVEELEEKFDTMGMRRAGFKAGKSWLISETLNYNIGLTDTRSMLEAISAYAQAQIAYYQAIYDYNLAVSKIEKVIGNTQRLHTRSTE